jgi:hypothetical protein
MRSAAYRQAKSRSTQPSERNSEHKNKKKKRNKPRKLAIAPATPKNIALFRRRLQRVIGHISFLDILLEPAEYITNVIGEVHLTIFRICMANNTVTEETEPNVAMRVIVL